MSLFSDAISIADEQLGWLRVRKALIAEISEGSRRSALKPRSRVKSRVAWYRRGKRRKGGMPMSTLPLFEGGE
jgi:hypothetical protein